MNLFSNKMISFLEDIGLVDLMIYKTNSVHDEQNPIYNTCTGHNIQNINNDLHLNKKYIQFNLEDN